MKLFVLDLFYVITNSQNNIAMLIILSQHIILYNIHDKCIKLLKEKVMIF